MSCGSSSSSSAYDRLKHQVKNARHGNRENLFKAVNTAQVHCLNEDEEHTIQHMLMDSYDHYLESDCDEQLLMVIPFQHPVNVDAIGFRSMKPEQGPRTVRLFVDGADMDFEDVEEKKPVQELKLRVEDLARCNTVELEGLRFRNVSKLTVFVVDNHGDLDTTTVTHMELLGDTLAGVDLSQLKKVG